METGTPCPEKPVKNSEKSYVDSNLIVAHMGGGTTMGLHMDGKIIDVIGDTEGAFGERSGDCHSMVISIW